MQLTDLVKTVDQYSDEELLERLRMIRNNRNTVRPAGQARAVRAAKKGGQGRVSKVESLLEGLTAEEIKLLLQGE
jgi:hypothetical protein